MKNLTRITIVPLLLAAACARSVAPGDAPSERPRRPDRRAEVASSQPRPSAPRALVDPRKDGFEVGFGEFAISLETRAIRPGPVTFVVRNGGKLVHGFELKSEDEGSHSGPGRGDRFEIEAATFDPGETMRIRTRLAPGLYEIECYVGDHEDRGMRIMLEVRRDAPLVRRAITSPDRIAIDGFRFQPASVTVETGTTVTWINRDPTEHTVTARGRSFSSEPLAAGATFRHRFERPGTYAYLCAIHPAMEATVKVTG